MHSEGHRADGENPSGVALEVAPDYLEDWEWDPQRLQVLDRNGLVVTDMDLGTQLTSGEMRVFGERIAVCVNFLRGVSNEWLRDAQRTVAATVHANPQPEECEDVRLDRDLDGWYVEVNGARVTFPGVTHVSYPKAKAYFHARVGASRRANRAEVVQ